MSLVEAATNVIVSYGVTVLTHLLVFPMFGLAASLGQNLTIGALFMIASLVRSYTLRRVFERWNQRSCEDRPTTPLMG